MNFRQLGLLTVLSLIVASSHAHADAFIGDAGHFFVHRPDLFVNNPDGRAFTVTVHRHMWQTDFGNNGDYAIRILAPDGAEVAKGAIPSMQPKVTIDVPKGAAGVYRIDVSPAGYPLTRLETSLDQSVVGCGDWDIKEGPLRTFILHLMAPRRWYFYVPSGTRKFVVRHTVFPFQSHREDYGLMVMNPRGQRVAALYGGKPLDVERVRPNDPVPVAAEIEVDEGTGGRFWSIWATGGDSHNFSDLGIQLQGVPPFLAPTPEQWFDPTTGKPAPKIVYDDSPIRIRDKNTGQSTDNYLWGVATYLGDEDYNGFVGPQTIYYSNPDNRGLDMGVVTYVVNEKSRLPVAWKVFAPNGKLALESRGEYGHHLSNRASVPGNGAGTYRVEIDAPQWAHWQEPTTPIVLAGKPRDSAATFNLQVGIARHWFFKVPAGVTQFDVGVAVKDPAHVLLCEVHAPDRMMDILYVRGGQHRTAKIDVPPGLSDKIWFIRTDVGSATRFVSEKPEGSSSQLRIDADITIKGVPGFLAPTFEQWFDPTSGK